MNAKVPFWYGLALTILGLWSYFGTGTTSLTALIPACFGLALLFLAVAVGQKRLRVPALYGVLVVALLGFAGSVSGVPNFVRVLFGSEVELPIAASAQATMAFFCFGLSLVAIKAVLDEWRAQRLHANQQGTQRSLPDR